MFEFGRRTNDRNAQGPGRVGGHFQCGGGRPWGWIRIAYAFQRSHRHAYGPGRQNIHIHERLAGRHHAVRIPRRQIETHVPPAAEGEWRRTEGGAFASEHAGPRRPCTGNPRR